MNYVDFQAQHNSVTRAVETDVQMHAGGFAPA